LDKICEALDTWVGAHAGAPVPLNYFAISSQNPSDVHFFSYEPNRDEKWSSLLVHHESSFQMSHEDVWLVDISLRPGELEHARLPHKASKWHWVDHHKSSLEFNPEGIFDEVHLDTSGEKCAADILMKMAWDQHECVESNPNIGFLHDWADVAHDRDLWINENSERNIKLDMILKAHLKRGRGRELLMYCLTAKPDDIIQQFQPYWQDGMKAFENSCKTAQNTSTVVIRANPPHIPVSIAWITGQGSDVADTLYETGDEIIVMLQLFPENVGISFRTKRDDVDLSQVAKAFGGGGHPQAAGGKLEHHYLMEGYSAIVADIINVLKEDV
jgi:oligoribonuclease NrnB/cAMP/cGMP phosphodiesterase (DHH superfamily)